MSDPSATIDAANAQRGPEGQKYLAAGRSVGMRLWEAEQPGEPKPMARRGYETVGYALSGRAELLLGDRAVPLSAGVSWLVPRDVEHSYRILETFTAIEATSPAAQGS